MLGNLLMKYKEVLHYMNEVGKGMKITDFTLKQFYEHLLEEEKSQATIDKYMRDLREFAGFIREQDISKEIVIDYKRKLMNDGYKPRSINSILASIHSYLNVFGLGDMKVKTLKIQRQVFCAEEKELTKAEYERLCKTAEIKKKERLSLILQTICGTGIRVSELKYITVEAIRGGTVSISMKGKIREILIVKQLQKKLVNYAKRKGIVSGCIFCTKRGGIVNRTNVWREMKQLCKEAGVNEHKVFPHNLRHLFARVFYNLEKDIAKLADVLGHSSIDTTRIYIVSTGTEHRKFMEKMRLIL